MQNPAIHVRVDPEQNMLLEDLAERIPAKKSEIVREAITTWINNLKRLEEIAIIHAK